ncbi:hypothetical protein [Streptomyces poonensis]|uniref:Lipoprotein n=1 Tax=Streptomyces poonensis TaxID=68255 RepID=A0A918P8U7_9ACTN|nr:hypothetical protein [Streptomyces poonensis]GGY92266.1 hypothetical protein GCM10010365_08430 [Streptomyces poonensis]GLJ87719.1 hypothetical protein GCM10017589_03190 [Streptomyces poonensis]
MAEQRRRLRSSTVILGGMGVVAAALTSCSSEPDRRCVDRYSYDIANGYEVISDSNCSSGSGSSSSVKKNKNGKKKKKDGTVVYSELDDGTIDAAWYYDADVTGGWADYGTFSRSEAVDRDGFGCSGGSGGG